MRSTLTTPTRGPIQSPIWKEDSPDTGATLKCIIDTAAAGETPAEEGHVDVMKWLAQRGADVSLADRYGQTPLHWAANNGHLNAMQWLVEKGSNIGAIGMNGTTTVGATGIKGIVATIGMISHISWPSWNFHLEAPRDWKGRCPYVGERVRQCLCACKAGGRHGPRSLTYLPLGCVTAFGYLLPYLPLGCVMALADPKQKMFLIR